MLRTGEGPLRPLWALFYEGLIRGTALGLRAGSPVSAVYVRGSFGLGTPVYGLSDADLVVVVETDPERPGENSRRLRERVRRLQRMLPSLRFVVEITVFEEHELEAVVRKPFPANDLDPAGPPAPARYSTARVLAQKHGAAFCAGGRLYGPLKPAWRLVRGRDVLSAMPASPADYRSLWVWLDLQFTWKHLFRACARPDLPQTAYHCAKSVAYGVRSWLWLARDELVLGEHAEVLERGLRALPEDERVLRMALELRREAARSPDAPLAEVVAWLAGMTGRIARLIGEEAEAVGGTDVRLLSGGDGPIVRPGSSACLEALGGDPAGLLPLADWRGLVVPELPDDAFLLLPGDPTDPGTLGRAAGADEGGPLPAFVHDGLLVLPTALSGMSGLGRAQLRSIQCAVTDPVSLALVASKDVCRFANLPGWSVQDAAGRAVAEHRALLAEPPGGSPASRLGLLLTAARAAHLSASLGRGDPELPLTVGAAARCLGPAGEGAWARYRDWRVRGEEPPAGSVEAFEDAVRGLPAYRE
jgi:predicted nucleotidyltransferase